MKQIHSTLLTPLYVKTPADTAWPDDAVFYLMTQDGLFLCRHHQFFSSCVRARSWPSELACHEPFLVPRYPRLTRRQIEEVIGFFDRIGTAHGAEAAVLVAWDRGAERTRIVIPDQLATVSRNRWGDLSPIGVEYETPKLPAELVIIGDIHSHVQMAAYSSHVDRDDETHRAGYHIVVGRIHREPPEFHVEAVVDGTRFELSADQVFESYRRRRTTFDPSWLGHVRLKTLAYMDQPTYSTAIILDTSAPRGTPPREIALAERAGDDMHNEARRSDVTPDDTTEVLSGIVRVRPADEDTRVVPDEPNQEAKHASAQGSYSTGSASSAEAKGRSNN